jgi:hypothetical protein
MGVGATPPARGSPPTPRPKQRFDAYVCQYDPSTLAVVTIREPTVCRWDVIVNLRIPRPRKYRWGDRINLQKLRRITEHSNHFAKNRSKP